MSSSVAPVGTTTGQPAQLALDPCAVILVLVDKTEADVKGTAPRAPAAPAGGHQGLDVYA